jgi:hypothetical protein
LTGVEEWVRVFFEVSDMSDWAIDTKWSRVSHDALQSALVACAGSYQRALVRGEEALSGSTLRGKANKYGSAYARSRANLLRRLARPIFGLRVAEVTEAHGRRVLVITSVK